MPTQRQLRVNNLLKQEIAQIIQREIQNPHVGFVTITGVQVSADFHYARVFVSVLGESKDKRESMRALIQARGFIRSLLMRRVDLRQIPQLDFRLDETAEKAQRMEILLRNVAEENTPPDEDSE